MLGALAIAGAAYIGFVALLFFMQRAMMYHPSSVMGTPVSAGVPEMVAIRLENKRGEKLVSWFKSASTNKPTIIFFQGNAGNIGDRGFKIRPFLDQGYGVLLVGYSGFGGNPGSPNEQGLYEDADLALTFLQRNGVAVDHWILYGESLGSGVAVEMAARFAEAGPVGAVVLEAPFTSMGATAQYHYPFVPARYLVLDRYDSLSKIGRIQSPLLIVHGLRDRTAPIKFGKELLAAAKEPKDGNWIDAAGHNDLFDHGADDAVIAFINAQWMSQ